MKSLRIILLIILSSLFIGAYQTSANNNRDTVYVNEHSTIHMRFPSKIVYVNIGHRCITARIVEGGMDLAVKAVEEFIFPTSLHCLTESGKLYAFTVEYGANTEEGQDSLIMDISDENSSGTTSNSATIVSEKGKPKETAKLDNASIPISYQVHTAERLISLGRRLTHIGKHTDGITAECINIVREKDSLYLVMKITNTSGMVFRFGSPEFSLSPIMGTGRSSLLKREVKPIWTVGTTEVNSGDMAHLVVCLGRLAIPKRQCLEVVLRESDGQRHISFTTYSEESRR